MEDIKQFYISSGLTAHLVGLLKSSYPNAKRFLVHILKELLRGTDIQKQILLDCNIIIYFPALLQNQDQNIRNKTIDCLELIASGSNTQKQAMIDLGILPEIVKNLKNENFETKRVIARLLANLTDDADGAHLRQILAAVKLEPLLNLIECRDAETSKVSC